MKKTILWTIGLVTLLALSGLMSGYAIALEVNDANDSAPKRKMDFDEDTWMYRDTPDVLPTGGTYYLWDDWGGTWCDAEKDPGPGDNLMCWAASASNALEWTGWGDVPGMVDTDDMFQHFQDHWTDQGGLPEYAWNWWFDGTEIVPGPDWSHVDVPGGGNFWPGEVFSDYFRETWTYAAALSAIDADLHDGFCVNLAVYGPGGHAITCWGYNYDDLDPDYYVGVWVTDSDDDKHLYDPPDTLRYYRVEYIGGRWYLQNFYGSNAWYIGGVQSLERCDVYEYSFRVNPYIDVIHMNLNPGGWMNGVDEILGYPPFPLLGRYEGGSMAYLAVDGLDTYYTMVFYAINVYTATGYIMRITPDLTVDGPIYVWLTLLTDAEPMEGPTTLEEPAGSQVTPAAWYDFRVNPYIDIVHVNTDLAPWLWGSAEAFGPGYPAPILGYTHGTRFYFAMDYIDGTGTELSFFAGSTSTATGSFIRTTAGSSYDGPFNIWLTLL